MQSEMIRNKTMKYIIALIILLIGCSNPISSDKHPNEMSKGQCYKCHKTQIVITWEE